MTKTFKEKLRTDLILLDGAFGTYAYMLGLTDACFKDRTGCMEYLNRSRPDLVNRIHCDYLEAGSDAIETNTFGANAVKLMEYGLSSEVRELNFEGARLARSAADSFSGNKFSRYVIGSMGPTGELPSSCDSELGKITYAELKEIYCEQAVGLIEGGVDALLIETGQDLLEMKAACNGAKKALKTCRKDLALLAECALVSGGRMLLGSEISAVMTVLGYLGVDVIGINCVSGPAEMEKGIAFLNAKAPSFISMVPNAGVPVEIDGKASYPLSPQAMAEMMARLVRKYAIDVVGGCCGTTPEHISQMRKMLKNVKKREIPKNFFYAGFYRGFDLNGKKNPIKVGERLNAQGSRRMKTLLEKRDYDAIVELGKEEERLGSMILDVCSVLTERDTEKEDAFILTKKLAESVECPLMIDSTDINVIEKSLAAYPGTAFINSANLEDGGKKARKIFALAQEHAGFVVNLVIDENGMAKSAEHKLNIAKRLYKIAVDEYKIEPHRLIFDMLTFTLGTGEGEYKIAAINTYEAIKKLKTNCPGSLSILGISNISFGLSKDARGLLNTVFLYHAAKAGLDMAIMNPAETRDYKDISVKERLLAESLIFDKRADALNRLVEYFAGKSESKNIKPFSREKEKTLTTSEKIRNCIFDRDKINIIPLMDEALKKIKPEEILNNVLIAAMKEVGEKLEKGEMVLPHVLQSAEVMKKAAQYIETFLSKTILEKRGKVLLATVLGDVHDIGKNLVKMILENNGFSVIDLGKQAPAEKIIEEAKKNNVDAVGLSALLVSTARHMKTCVEIMHEAGLSYPIIIGGAPINERFAEEISILKNESVYKGGVFYAKDAFSGLNIMRALMSPEEKKKVMDNYYSQVSSRERERKKITQKRDRVSGINRKKISPCLMSVVPPFYEKKTVFDIDVKKVFSFLNKDALFNAWGTRLLDKKKKVSIIEREYTPLLEELKKESIEKGWFDFRAVYGYFKCQRCGEDVNICGETGELLEKIHFSCSEKGASLAGYFFGEETENYSIAVFQAVTVGKLLADAIDMLNNEKEFTRAFFLHNLGAHLAEALACYMQARVQKELKPKNFQLRRYSPGFPLWKTLEDQKKIFKLLDAENELDIHLTENCQIVPEASTTAMIVCV